MTDDFEQRARRAAEKVCLRYTVGNEMEIDHFKLPSFILGAKWARAEMQVKSVEVVEEDPLRTQMRGYFLDRAADREAEKIERLKGELREVNAMYVAQARELEQAKDAQNHRGENKRLREELDKYAQRAAEFFVRATQKDDEIAELKLDCERLNTELDHFVKEHSGLLNERAGILSREHSALKQIDNLKRESTTTKQIIADSKSLPADISEVEWVSKLDHDSDMERLSLLAESYRAILKKLLESRHSKHDWPDQLINIVEEARQALEVGK